MAQQIVKVTADAGTLGQPRALSEKLASCLELGIDRRQTLARECFLREKSSRSVGHELEGNIGDGQHDPPVPSPVKPHDREKGAALREDPGERRAARRDLPELEGDQDEQRAFQAEALRQRHQAERGDRLAGEKEVERSFEAALTGCVTGKGDAEKREGRGPHGERYRETAAAELEEQNGSS